MTIWVMVTDGERIRTLEIVESNDTPNKTNIMNLMQMDRDDLLADEAVASDVLQLVKAESVLINDEPVATDFIQTINTRLQHARSLRLFDHLVVIAPSQILGVLMNNLTTAGLDPLMLELETDLIDSEQAVIRAVLPI